MNSSRSNANLDNAPNFVLHNYSYVVSTQPPSLLHSAYTLICAAKSSSIWVDNHHQRATSLISSRSYAKRVQYPTLEPPISVKENARSHKEWGAPIGDDDDVFVLDDLEDFHSTDFSCLFDVKPVLHTTPTREESASLQRNLDRHFLHDVIPQPHVHPSSAVKAPREALKQVPYKKTRPISIPPYISPFSPTSYMRSAWLVPIRGAFSWDRCTPAVMLDFSHAIPASSNPSTGDPISWTHSSVKSFWAFLLHVRENGTAGAIGLSFHASRNGTRMSQVINTVSSTLPGAEYQQDSAHSVATGAVSIATTAPPPRIVLSNVDHVKVYHDASIAMHLRNILHLWSYAVPTEIQSQALTKIRVLKGAKLVLVDERSRGILIS